MENTTRIDGKKVDREVGEAFKTFVLKKHGKIRGVFSDEVTKALAMYLQENKARKKREDEREEKEKNIASWGGIFQRRNLHFERVYLEVEEMLKDDGLIFSPETGRIAFVDNMNAKGVKAAIHMLLREEKYFNMLCQRYGLLVLDDDSVIEPSTLKE